MLFDKEHWKTHINAAFGGIRQWLTKGDVPFIAYGTIAGLTLWPLIEAAVQTGQFWSAIAALYGVASGVGSNLIAEQLQRWKDRADKPSEAEVIKWVQDQLITAPDIVEDLNKILDTMQSISTAGSFLDKDTHNWLSQKITSELQSLGLHVIQQENGIVIFGINSKIEIANQVLVQGNITAPTVIGTGNELVYTNNYIRIENLPPRHPSSVVDLRRAYLNQLLVSTSHVSLAGINPNLSSDGTTALLNLGSIYTALVTEQADYDSAPEGIDNTIEKVGHTPALTQLNRNPRLVLLGGPGSGKSTFVNFVALCLAGAALGHASINLKLLTVPLPDEEERVMEPVQEWHHGELLPVRIILRDFAARGLPEPGKDVTGSHLWQFIVSELGNMRLSEFAPDLESELREKGGLLLFDGLDEVPEADLRRNQIREAILKFVTGFPSCRVLVTSRTYAYQRQDWQLPEFAVALLSRFSQTQITYFIDRWYEHIAPMRRLSLEDAKGRAVLLKRAIFNSDRLQVFAERPLILTLMASLHAWRGGNLPEKREELYAAAVELLLDQWESPKIVRDAQGNMIVYLPSLAEWLKTDRDKVRKLLNQLAYEAHSTQSDLVGTADIPQSKLVNGLLELTNNPDMKLNRLVEFLSQRAGILLPNGVGVYSFPHRSFQEYLAACYLTDLDYPDTLAALLRADPNRWREVTLLAGAKAARGSASTIWSLVEALCYREPGTSTNSADAWGGLLAGQALCEVADLSRDIASHNIFKLERIQRWLLFLLRGSELPPLERTIAGNTLARIGDPRSETSCLDDVQFCNIPGGDFWMGDGKNEYVNHNLGYDFWISRFPITQALYNSFVEDGGYVKERFWKEAAAVGIWSQEGIEGWRDKTPREAPRNYGLSFDLPNHPVVGITWFEAVAFTHWLEEVWIEQGYLSKDVSVGLPSEAEWEKAARGGLSIPIQPVILAIKKNLFSSQGVSLELNPAPKRCFPWGADELIDVPETNRANYEATNIGATSAVGCFPLGASPYGCEEIAGNCWEWVRSEYRDYPYFPSDGREVLKRDQIVPRILRGGVYYESASQMQCTFRLRHNPLYRFDSVGFRVVVRLNGDDWTLA